jgi:suppressor of G2 allele of SKP1
LASIFVFKQNKCITLKELTKLAEAVADANKAIGLDPTMHKAYYRKGLVSLFIFQLKLYMNTPIIPSATFYLCNKLFIVYSAACINLEEYQTAKAALELGSSYAPGDSRFTRLLKECDERIAGEQN